MTYTVKEVSELTGIPISTLRFYDKNGLLPYLRRDEHNRRIFSEIDIATLQIVECLKNTRMKIKDIKKLAEWTRQGDSTLQNRCELFDQRKIAVENEISQLQKALKIIQCKQNYYRKALADGTEKHLLGKTKLPYAEEFLAHVRKL